MNELLHPAHLTLGILAGGRATRLGGIDKAWIERDGLPQVLRIARRFAHQVSSVLVSANRESLRYAKHDLQPIPDKRPETGPIGGLEALADACSTEWLLTIPVDLVDVNECLLQSLRAAAAANGAFAEDDDGVQPLVALWRVEELRGAARAAIDAEDFAVHSLQKRLGLACVHFAGVRFGNLNTTDDLKAAGFSLP